MSKATEITTTTDSKKNGTKKKLSKKMSHEINKKDMGANSPTPVAADAEVTTKTAEMHMPLATICAKHLEQLGMAHKSDALARHELGLDVLMIETQKKIYGGQAVQKLAAALSMDKATLYKAKKVAVVWTPAEFDELVRRKNTKGLELSWSHFELLAQEKDDEKRTTLLSEAIDRSYSVRELQARIGGRSKTADSTTADGKHESTDADSEQTPKMVAQQMTAEADHLIESATRFETAIVTRLNRAGAQLASDDRHAADAMCEHLEKTAVALAAKAASLKRALTPTPVSVSTADASEAMPTPVKRQVWNGHAANGVMSPAAA
jgi:flagellin-like hook-associated protein FlgL